jgi:hypothetical protein
MKLENMGSLQLSESDPMVQKMQVGAVGYMEEDGDIVD